MSKQLFCVIEGIKIVKSLLKPGSNYSLLYSATLTSAVSFCGEGNNGFMGVPSANLSLPVDIAMSIPFELFFAGPNCI